MGFSANMHKSHFYTVFFAPRGSARMLDMGMNISQQYLNSNDRLVGIIGKAGSGKSVFIKGMFPGLELTNDDGGVNVRPLPILDIEEGGFYRAHTYHLDVKFESGFTPIGILADAINNALSMGKRVIVEHFDMIYPYLNRDANLLIGIGEEILVTRPTVFGPDPIDIRDIVFKSILYRRMSHSAEDLCEFILKKYGLQKYIHADVRRGFILGFDEKPTFEIPHLEAQIKELIKADLQLSFADDNHIMIGEDKHHCTGPRMHMKRTSEIKEFSLMEDFILDPESKQYLLVGLVGITYKENIGELNKIKL